MDYFENLRKNLFEAQKAGNDKEIRALKVLISSLKNKEIELRGVLKELTEADFISIVQKEVKQRQESIEMFKKGNRDDLVNKELEEMEVLKKYLPTQMGEEEIKKIVMEVVKSTGASTIKDMGKVIGELKGRLAGKADMGLVGRIVKGFLEKQVKG